MAGRDDKLDMFLSYCNVLNILPVDATTTITTNNRTMSQKEFADSILMRDAGDGLDSYRHLNNAMLEGKAEASNNIVRDHYLTISVVKKTVDEARTFFTRVHNELVSYMGKLASHVAEMGNMERLRVLHDFFRMDGGVWQSQTGGTGSATRGPEGREQYFNLDLKATMRHSHDFRDYIFPDGLWFKGDHFINGQYLCALRQPIEERQRGHDCIRFGGKTSKFF